MIQVRRSRALLWLAVALSLAVMGWQVLLRAEPSSLRKPLLSSVVSSAHSQSKSEPPAPSLGLQTGAETLVRCSGSSKNDTPASVVDDHWLHLHDTSSAEEQAKGRSFLWLLPPSPALLFCTSHDASPEMRDVIIPRSPDVYVSGLERGCPASPVIPMYVLERGYEGWHAPHPFGLRKEKLALWRSVTLSIPLTLVNSAGNKGSNNPKGSANYFGNDDGASGAVLEYCVLQCLRSPYCRLVQLVRRSTHQQHRQDGRVATENRTCFLFHNEYNNPLPLRGTVVPRKEDGQMFIFAFRREHRPSLVAHQWRLVAFAGPGDVARLEDGHDHCEECLWWVRLDGPFGHIGGGVGHGGVKMNVSVVVASHGQRHRARDAADQPNAGSNSSSSSSNVLLQYRDSFLESQLKVDLRHLVLSPSFVGQWIAVSVRCEGTTLHDHDFPQYQSQEQPRAGCGGIAPAQWSFLLHYQSYDMRLAVDQIASSFWGNAGQHWYSPPTLPPQRGDSRERPRQDLSMSLLVHGNQCAPLLRRDECCFRGLVVHHIAPRSMRMHDASNRERSGTCIFIHNVLSDGSNVTWKYSNSESKYGPSASVQEEEPRMPCIRIVDGHYGLLNSSGVALFPNLVVRVVCTRDEMQRRARSSNHRVKHVFLRATPFEGPIVAVPLQYFLACGDGGGNTSSSSSSSSITLDRGKAGSPTAASTLLDHRIIPQPSRSSDRSPILVSTCVYECRTCVLQLVQNIRAFIPNSIIVIRITSAPKIDELSQDDEAWLKQATRNFTVRSSTTTTTTPQVLIYRAVYPARGLHLAHLHAGNIDFIEKIYERRFCSKKQKNKAQAESGYPCSASSLSFYKSYSHVLFLSSNELLVRHGAAEYINRFDLSTGNPLPDSTTGGFLFRQASRKKRIDNVAFASDDDLHRYGNTFYDWGKHMFGMQNEFHLAMIMRMFNLTRWPREQVYLEGSFFSRTLAKLFADILLTLFDAAAKPARQLSPNTSSPSTLMCQSEGAMEKEAFRVGQFALVDWYATSEIIPYMFFHHLCTNDADDENAHSSPRLHASAVPNQLLTPAITSILRRWTSISSRSLRCGQRVTTVVWANLAWSADLLDVRLVRCSPFEVPFGFKRVARDAGNHVRRHIAAIQSDPTRAMVLREDREGYCGVI